MKGEAPKPTGVAMPRRADVRHQPGAPVTAPDRLSPPQVMVEHPPFCVWDREQGDAIP